MSTYVISDLPTVYADMNVFRYVAYGELTIKNHEQFKWVYSYVHLNEIARTGNKDALKGMEQLKAIELDEIYDKEHKPTGEICLREYADPFHRYEQHLKTISGDENTEDSKIELLLRFFGADNFEKLSISPAELRNEVERLTRETSPAVRDNLISRAETAAEGMEQLINDQLKERQSLEETRLSLGLHSGARSEVAKSNSPIDALWKILEPAFGDYVSKDQYFGFEQNPNFAQIPFTQSESFAGAYAVLNMMGINPDRGLAKREKIRNILSDGEHVGMASYCNAFLSSDRRSCDKANVIYRYTNSITQALWFPYKREGCVMSLEVTDPDP